MRTILHSDLNSFYASVELLYHPEAREQCVVVGGSEESRHGIVLAKNQHAKVRGITTGMVLWQARQLCPELVVFPPRHDVYAKFSQQVMEIYRKYTDKVEPFGIDEAWLDVTESKVLFGTGEQIAAQISEDVKKTTGLTVSIGVSFSKIFAKIGSDLKKPDAISVITPENYREIVWRLSAKAMLGVGRRMFPKLRKLGIETVGDIAKASPTLFASMFGKRGPELILLANGHDIEPVQEQDFVQIKSVGNSLTSWHDMSDKKEIKALLLLLSESVASRMMDSEIKSASVVQLSVTENDLSSFTRQKKIQPTICSSIFANVAMALFEKNHDSRKKVRGLGVSVSGFSDFFQENFFDGGTLQRKETAEKAVESIRKKHGRSKMKRAIILSDPVLSELNIKGSHPLAV